MKRDIQTHIDRTVGTEGILRIPSWWMHKILSDLVQYCDSLESSDAGIKEYLESQLNLVGGAVKALDARVTEVESHELFAIVSELPSEPKENTIYLIPSANGEGNNILTEWVYINDAWEQFGEFKADVDLSGYVKKEDIAELQQNKEDKTNKVTALSDESTDVQYPSAKTVYDLIKQLKERIEEQDLFIEDLQNTKIDRENDDYYPKMAVGLADNLAGVDVVDSEINFRRSGGGAISDGVARIESIKGNSVVWNQLYPTGWSETREGITSTSVNGKISAVGTTTTTYFRFAMFSANIANHKYLFTLSGASSVFEGKSFGLLNRGPESYGKVTQGFAYLFYLNADASAQRNIGIQGLSEGITLNENYVVNQYDLTQMFGAGNEPTTIEEFYARIPMGVDLNAYNEGEVIHMDVQSIESQGVNAWDEEWEVGDISGTTGVDLSGTSTIRTGFIRVTPNLQYYISVQGKSNKLFLRSRLYDADKNFIGITSASGADIYTNEAFTIPPNAHYIRFAPQISVVTQSDLFCINLSDASINGKYYPYIKRVEDLSIIRKYFPDGMKSAVSAHDEIRYNKASGKWEKVVRIGEVDLGIYRWYKDSSKDFFKCEAPIQIGTHYLCGKYINISYAQLGVGRGINVVDSGRGTTHLRISDLSYTNEAELNASIQGVILYYELAEPIVTELDEADQFKDLDYKVWNAGTEKAIAEGKSAPLAADITYGFNAIGKIKELESLVAALRAKVGI